MWNLTRISAAATLVLAGSAAGCFFEHDGDDDGDDQGGVVALERTDLVADQAGHALRVDPDVVNAWGIAAGPDTGFWIADAGTERTSILDGDGAQLAPAIGLGDEATGVVYNGGDQLVITDGPASAPARFVFATTGGSLIGWSPDVSAGRPVVARAGADTGAVYTGLAITDDLRGTWIYAANFAARRVDVFDGEFRPIQSVIPMFVDPGLPAGYAPFGIQAMDGLIYVAYALQSAEDPEEEVTGPGLGVVSAFLPTGEFAHRVLAGAPLDAPWAITRAPSSFGRFAGALLIGNFGDGTITALDPASGRVIGTLDQSGTPIVIEGLWGLSPGNGTTAGSADALYFTAGPSDELHGLFGRIEARAYGGDDDDDGDDGGDDGGGGDPY